MPIVKSVRSEETTSSGKPLYIIKTPIKDFNGKRHDVPFYQGTGRTPSRTKAQLMSEVFKYRVIIPASVEPWVEAQDLPAVTHSIDFEDDESENDYDSFEDYDDDYATVKNGVYLYSWSYADIFLDMAKLGDSNFGYKKMEGSQMTIGGYGLFS